MKRSYEVLLIIMSLAIICAGASGIEYYNKMEKDFAEANETINILEQKVTSMDAEINTLNTQSEELLHSYDNALELKGLLEDKNIKLLEELKKEKEKNKVVESKTPSRGEKTDSGIYFEATAYTAYCDGCIGITKTGVDVRNTTMYEGKTVVAVDPTVIPLHSLLKITTDDGKSFYAQAMDIGSDIKGYRIDILMSSKKKAYTFGRQNIVVEVLREGK